MYHGAVRVLTICVLYGLSLAGVVRAQELPPVPPPAPESESPAETGYAGLAESGHATRETCGLPECCPSSWTVGAEAIFLHRSDPQDQVLAFGLQNPDAALRGGDFDFGTSTGIELTVLRTGVLGTAVDLEGKFFMVDGWNARASVPVAAGVPVQVNTNPPTFIVGQTATIDAAYQSRLYNTEINARTCLCGSLSGLLGFRCLELDEHLGMAFPDTPVLYDATTRNHLYGAQLGLETGWSWRRLRSDVFGKAGIYGNAASHETQASSPAFVASAQADKGAIGFVGECGFNAKFFLTQRLAVIGGYRLLWVEGVALASDQIPVTDLLAQTGITTDGGVFYHGANAGVEFTW